MRIISWWKYSIRNHLSRLHPGEVGELVITTLTKEAFPVIRYRTRDLTRMITEPCPCGRTFHRIQRIMGRTDDMLIIKGVNVFPTQIEAVLFDIEGTQPHYNLVVERENNEDGLPCWWKWSSRSFSTR